MYLNHIRFGNGAPLLLIHGVGGSWRSWSPVISILAAHREVIAIDLPGCGRSKALDNPSVANLSEAVASFLHLHQLDGIDAVGICGGATIVMELARRGSIGRSVAINPLGFVTGWHKRWVTTKLSMLQRCCQLLHKTKLLTFFTEHSVLRQGLLASLVAKPDAVSPRQAYQELLSLATTQQYSQQLGEFLAYRPGMHEGSSSSCPVALGWSRADRLMPIAEADTLLKLVPAARLHWLAGCGHLPQLDHDLQVADLVLQVLSADGATHRIIRIRNNKN